MASEMRDMREVYEVEERIVTEHIHKKIHRCCDCLHYGYSKKQKKPGVCRKKNVNMEDVKHDAYSPGFPSWCPLDKFVRCRICGRRFISPMPHKCLGGLRKRLRRAARQRGWDNIFEEVKR